MSEPRNRRNEFAYLNESGIAHVSRVRTLLEEAFQFHTGDKAAIRARFRSPDNQPHFGAAFELILHELARRRSLLPEAEAGVPGGVVDLRITSPLGRTVYVEATMMHHGENVHYSEACDAVAGIRYPGIGFHLRVKRAPHHPLKLGLLTSEVAAHLGRLDSAMLSTDIGDNKTSRFTYTEGEAVLEFLPFRKEGSDGGLSLYDVLECEMADDADIREAVERKHRKRKYELDHPYVIAICSAKGFAEPRMFKDALFRKGYGEQRGFFVGSTRARVSAVLACQCFRPSSLSGARMQMFLNPNATYPLHESIFGCEPVNADCVDEQETIPECSLADALKVPAGWLEAD